MRCGPQGALVTIDATGTQTAIAETTVAKGGDDRIADTHATLDNDHGRLERRRHSVGHDVAWMRSDRRCPLSHTSRTAP